MEWTPIAFGMFKVSALGIGMYYAIKWHYDQGDKEERRAALRTGGVMAAAFLVDRLYHRLRTQQHAWFGLEFVVKVLRSRLGYAARARTLSRTDARMEHL